jgi:hypothetical protein
MEKLLNQLVDRLKTAQGAGLVSVILYGSAASGQQQGSYSDLNVFCALERVGMAELQHAEPIVRWWRDQGNPSPLMMSRQETLTSTDCFPIEFHDMLERRRVLYGEDLIAGLQIDYSFYRAQVEHELRAKLLRLRSKAAGVLSERELLSRLMVESVSTFLILGRHALRLAAANAPWDRREIAAQLSQRFGVDPQAFYTLLDLRDGKSKPRQVEPAPLFEQYLQAMTTLVDSVDRLER